MGSLLTLMPLSTNQVSGLCCVPPPKVVFWLLLWSVTQGCKPIFPKPGFGQEKQTCPLNYETQKKSRAAIKIVPSLRGTTYEERLERLSLRILEKRGKCEDLISLNIRMKEMKIIDRDVITVGDANNTRANRVFQENMVPQ